MQIQCDRLVVQIDEPGTIYRGARFDWTGFIRQVTLDGAHAFCVDEAVDGTGTGGSGICNEFGMINPVGYENTKPGEWFPKIGVGLERRVHDGPYSFSSDYQIKPFEVKAQAQKDSAVFVSNPRDERGYAMQLRKTLRVAGDKLRIDYELTNTGRYAFQTEEYTHNFLLPGQGKVGEDLFIKLPFNPKLRDPRGPISTHEDQIRFANVKPGEVIYSVIKPIPTAPRGVWWQMRHRPTGLTVRETVNFPWSRFAVWGTDRVLSAEAFFEVKLAPGQVARWSRLYRFSKREQ